MATRTFLAAAFAVTLTGWVFVSPVSADGTTPSPTPSPSASPSGSASPTASASPSASARPSASPSATASASPRAGASPSPTPAPSASASPSPTPSPTPTEDPAVARARDAALLASARTLSQIIDAQARVAQDELVALDAQVTAVAADLDAVNAEIAALQARSNGRRGLHDRLERDALRLAELPPNAMPADLSDAQRDALDDLRAVQGGLLAGQARLAERVDSLARLKDSVGAKQAQLVRLRDRARTLAAAAAVGDTEARAAQVAVLTSLAQDATAAQTALAQLVASSMVRDPAVESAWSLPLRGPITQAFGPSALPYSPPRAFGGVLYAHFHDAIDIAAPLGTPVAAAADGQVTFVGHLPDGAMIVLVAHAGGLVSVYAHLDDTFALPPVRAGQTVKAGQVIGFVGLTGMTTGPHLHFGVLRGGQPIDPLFLITAGS